METVSNNHRRLSGCLLPAMLVIRSVMGTIKTIVFVALVVIMATLSGKLFGTYF